MNTPEPRPDDEQIAALLAAIDRDLPLPDRAFLDRLREQTMDAFQGSAPPASPASPRNRLMFLSPFRWIAASAVAVLVFGIVLANWIANRNRIVTEETPEEKFAVSKTLTDDGRIGKVTDSQGVVSIRPVLHERWSPVQPRLVLKPGDWLRTDSRGANAVALKLIKSADVIVGPHSTVELVNANEIRLLAGEVEVSAANDAPVELHGPDKQKLTIKGKQLYRVEKDKLVRIEKEPLWLAGFKGTTANESIGSLIATIDGRNVPLTVGYHHVAVDIRDQIARTVIEESFVNRTDGILEGVFHFPLPADASISGFGMWIGDQLVEADVVEKQRARQIYETILREKRDPGLLEWSGGNIFKARVFPIPPQSEKRIKITYTQVLPMQGNRYRYGYGLQSELLKQHPLRDLKIDVKVNSAIAIKSVVSPTHAARIDKTGHSGHVEFTAQEYTPTRDFEAVIEVDGRQSDIVVIPHRRGDDGYFMVQLTPPGGAGDWERPLIPNGEPLRLLVIADTSASMDRSQRTTQNAVLASLLGALTPKDTVNVAACDVNCDWIFEKPVPASPASVAAIQQSLAKRTSLGWTDLDKAFASAIAMSEPGTQVVYVGDGIITTGDADPVAFAKRLHRLYEGKNGTFHAVAVGGSYESAVLKAIASLGGGSVRRVTGEQGPQAVALELLGEIATPSLRNLKVEFKGLRTARVYPEELPNVAAGSQQILLGRYLPEDKNQDGEIIVTGLLGSKPVRFTSKVTLKDAEQGNSFIPRLWARMHLDKLLEQGSSETIKQDIIALSEEYQIITPYTSLLVLESDADRERFAVKRRFQMRDGEKFFADGRDNAAFELKQKQMKLAGDYRTALRRRVLAELQRLGRDSRMFQNSPHPTGRPGLSLGFSGDVDSFSEAEGFGISDPTSTIISGSGGGLPASGIRGEPVGLENEATDTPPLTSMAGLAGEDKEIRDRIDERGTELADHLESDEKWGELAKAEPDMEEGSFKDSKPDFGYSGLNALYVRDFDSYGLASSTYGRPTHGRSYRGSPLSWLGSLFPSLAPPTSEPKEPKSSWPAPAVALSRSLLRRDQLALLKGGLVLTRETDSFDPRHRELTSRSRRLELVSPNAWLTRAMPDGGQVMVNWCDAKEYGAYTTAYQLGRVRASNKLDLKHAPLDLADYSLSPLHVSFWTYTPVIESIDKNITLLILTNPDYPDYESRFLIDMQRHALLNIEQRTKGKVTSTTKFEDFTNLAGVWWAKKVEILDEKEQRISLTTQTITEVAAGDFTKQMTQELADKADVLFLRQPLPRVADAKAAATGGKATFDDQAVLTMHFAATQQWAKAKEHLQQCEKLAAGKPGMRWLVNAFLLTSRRHEEFRKRLLEEATTLASATDARTRANDNYLMTNLISQGWGVLQTNEMMVLSDTLEPVAARQPARLQAMKTWRSRVTLLLQSGQQEKALALSKALAVEFPRDHNLQVQYAQNLANAGNYEAAYAWLAQTLASDAKWDIIEVDNLRSYHAQFLQNQGRYRELADYLAETIKRNPEAEQPLGMYLAALVRSNQATKAETLATQWLTEAQVNGELPRPVAIRLTVAIAFALGQGYNLYTNRIEERWFQPLAKAALFFARRDDHIYTSSTILQHWRFQSTDEAREVRKAIVSILLAELDKLSPAQLENLVGIVWTDAGLEDAGWKKIADGLRSRWNTETKPRSRNQIGRTLLRVLERLGSTEALAFLRVQWKEGPERDRPQFASQLFNALLSQSWTAEIEDEAFSLLDKFTAPEETANALHIRVAALHRLTDAMLQTRYQALMKKVEHPEKLPRTDLRKKQDDNHRLAREGYADRLGKEAPKQAKPFSGWLVAERVWIDTLLDRRLPEVVAESWEFLLLPVPKADPENASSVAISALDEQLRGRFLVTLTSLAARKGADPALIDRLMKYLDGQIKTAPDDPRWKSEKFRLLIALDRSKELEAELRPWAAAPDAENRWRLALGYLLAEQGKVAEAIKLFEAVEAADELSPADHLRLAEWYLVENRREQHEKAMTAARMTTDEYQLSRRLQYALRAWQASDGHLPSQLDPEVLRVFKALFEKSNSPQQHLWILQQFYQASRDFRLLSMLPDGMTGHTAARVYPFLEGMRNVLVEVRDEATADELTARIAKVRPAAKTAIDQRALDLLELLVERRASEVQNQAGPHADKALAALQRAFKRGWSSGESRLMADFLAGLGRVPQAAISTEQLRQLETLHRDAATGSSDRLHIAWRRAETLAIYARAAEAMDLLASALMEFEDANGGILPVSANPPLSTMVSLTENARHYDRGEKVLLEQLKHPVHAEQTRWLTERLNELYHHALVNNGDVSLGKGATLYKAYERKLFADLVSVDQNHRYRLLGQVCQMYRTAHDVKLAGVVADLKAFAFKRLPPILRDQVVNYDGIVRDVSETLHKLAGPRDAVAFLLDRFDDQPDWVRYSNQDTWSQHSYRLGQWREEAKELGDLEARLLKIVLAELQRELRLRESRGRTIYARNHNYFWAAKEADFAKAAEEVLVGRKDSGAAVEYIAEYLFFGLPREKRAIEILFAAHERKLLGESGQWQLVDYLHRQQRYAESIPLLLPMVELRPENLAYRTKLMHAYFRTGKQAELLALLKQTDAFFHEKDRWAEHVLAGLAVSCLENKLHAQAAAYYEELIPMHQRTHARRGIGNGVLSSYYGQAAEAYAGLGKTKETVDMASGAVVSWGPRQQQRKDALEALVRVLESAPDLAAYAAGLDKEKLDSAIVRKAIGQAFVRKGDHARAIPQFRLAAELQPNDAETYQALLVCYDKIGDKEGALRQLLEAVELSRRDIKLYESLGQRLADLQQLAEAERANTSIVEMLPNESESHALLAEIRERQNRWGEAISHWERVAAIRELEPTGLLRLAAAQIHEKSWDKAAATLGKIRGKSWPPRFSDADRQARELEQKIPQKTGK
ncbi:VIT domain-containing protein [Zavarzinella formosa]|uniref:VIT domain-containing protein n=1 Tax=Zavarzinella formosa TaxID=360055 RepID=UPI0002F1CE09|nr:VIT domain-containing protein [Zavarzinella formosa]